MTDTIKGAELPTKTLTVRSDKIIGSLYSQVVGVIVTDNDITLEFVYVNPRPDNEEANVVARITLPKGSGEGLAKSIVEIIAQHEANKAKEKEL